MSLQLSPVDITKLTDVAGRENSLVEETMRRDLAQCLTGNDPLLVEVLEYALFGGGKRIRPLLAILSARICGCDDDAIYRLAAAFEYLHVATLIHDDVIDHAATRRGREAVGAKYGMPAAILAGDWLHARSMYLIGRLAGPEGLEVFCSATTAMVDGEFLQLRHVANPAVSSQEYFAVIERKTGRLISSTCEIGAIFGDATPRQREALRTYGARIGAAFQVVDDLLDYLGDQEATGKKTGNDFIEGKLTLPLIHTLGAASATDRSTISDCILGDREDAAAYATICSMMEQYDGYTTARKTAEELVAGGIGALDIFRDENPETYGLLRTLALYILSRKS
ncbi:polyprenyl synthetase family protein [Desulfolithobacter sp.]